MAVDSAAVVGVAGIFDLGETFDFGEIFDFAVAFDFAGACGVAEALGFPEDFILAIGFAAVLGPDLGAAFASVCGFDPACSLCGPLPADSPSGWTWERVGSDGCGTGLWPAAWRACAISSDSSAAEARRRA